MEWRAVSGVTNRYYSIPADRFGDSLIAGSSTAGWVGLTKGQMLGSYTTATVATYQAATWFEAWAPVTSDGTCVADLTRGEKAPAGATLATPSQWASDSAVYPVTSVTLYLDPSEVGFRYTLHWKLPLQSEMVQSVVPSRVNGAFNQLLADGTTRQIPDGAAVLTGTVAKDATFWLTRDFDAAPATWYPSGGLLLPTALANDSTKPKVWYFPSRTAQNPTGIIPPVDRSNWQDVIFGFSTTMCTGFQVNTPPSRSQRRSWASPSGFTISPRLALRMILSITPLP